MPKHVSMTRQGVPKRRTALPLVNIIARGQLDRIVMSLVDDASVPLIDDLRAMIVDLVPIRHCQILDRTGWSPRHPPARMVGQLRVLERWPKIEFLGETVERLGADREIDQLLRLQLVRCA